MNGGELSISPRKSEYFVRADRPITSEPPFDPQAGVDQFMRHERGVQLKNAVDEPQRFPFGGVRGTGNGHREAGHTMLDAFTEWKSIYVDFSGRIQRAQIDNN